MVRLTPNIITSRFHNLSNEALADELGHADALAARLDLIPHY